MGRTARAAGSSKTRTGGSAGGSRPSNRAPSNRAGADRPGAMTADASCVWVYGVAAGDPGPLADDVTGVGGGRVRAVRAAGLTAIVEDVSQLEFGAARSEEHSSELQSQS